MHHRNAEKCNLEVQPFSLLAYLRVTPLIVETPDLKVGFTPRMGQNRFHEQAKAGTIAPFFIKALVLGDTFAVILATLHCSDATICPTSDPSPCDPVGRHNAAM
ncbi:MAG: hypothetical protein RSG92_28790, partial [Pseudomonas sp.]